MNSNPELIAPSLAPLPYKEHFTQQPKLVLLYRPLKDNSTSAENVMSYGLGLPSPDSDNHWLNFVYNWTNYQEDGGLSQVETVCSEHRRLSNGTRLKLLITTKTFSHDV